MGKLLLFGVKEWTNCTRDPAYTHRLNSSDMLSTYSS